MNTKRITMGIVTCCLAASLLSGCGGAESASGSGEKSAFSSDAKSAAPIEPAKETPVAVWPTPFSPPIERFKVGNRQGHVYEVANFDKTSRVSASSAAVLGNDLYYHGKEKWAKHSRLVKVTYDKDALSAPIVLCESGGRERLAANGKIVVFRTVEGKCGIYDGQTLTEKGPWLGSAIASGEGDAFYVVVEDGISEVRVSENGFEAPQRIFDNFRKEPYRLTSGVHPIFGDAGGVYFSARERKPGKSDADMVPLLFYADKRGKEIRRFVGIEEMPRGWVVTEHYVIHAALAGAFRVFDRQTGAQLADVKLRLSAYDVAHVQGDVVLAFDERAGKLYRIDF